MEKHLRLLSALCRICGQKIKDQKKKEDVSKHPSIMEQIWGISVLLDSPNVHLGCIYIKCRVKCSNKKYLAGQFSASQVLKTWFPHKDGDCPVCNQVSVARGRPTKRKRTELKNKSNQDEQTQSDIDSASKCEDEPQASVLQVYSIAIDS